MPMQIACCAGMCSSYARKAERGQREPAAAATNHYRCARFTHDIPRELDHAVGASMMRVLSIDMVWRQHTAAIQQRSSERLIRRGLRAVLCAVRELPRAERRQR